MALVRVHGSTRPPFAMTVNTANVEINCLSFIQLHYDDDFNTEVDLNEQMKCTNTRATFHGCYELSSAEFEGGFWLERERVGYKS